MSIEQEAAELLEKAADGFESGRYGWTKRVAHDRVEGQDLFCSVGALFYEAGLYQCNGTVARGGDVARMRYLRAEQTLAKVVNVNWQSMGELTSTSGIPRWNDSVASGVEEVIDKMKEAAKDLRNQA